MAKPRGTAGLLHLACEATLSMKYSELYIMTDVVSVGEIMLLQETIYSAVYNTNGDVSVHLTLGAHAQRGLQSVCLSTTILALQATRRLMSDTNSFCATRA